MRRRIEGPTAFMTWQREMIALATRRFVRPLDWPAIRTRYDAYLREAQRWNERARRVRRYEDPYNGLVWIIRANAQELDAIDAMAAIVETLGDRLGEAEATLQDGLQQLRMTYVQLKNQAGE